MNVRDLPALERTATWLDELIRACERGGSCYGKNPDLARDVTRKAKALRTSLTTLFMRNSSMKKRLAALDNGLFSPPTHHRGHEGDS
jgi:hypothetical protein